MKKKMISLMITAALLTTHLPAAERQPPPPGLKIPPVGKAIPSVFPSSRNTVLWITAGKDFWKALKEEGLEEGKNLTVKVNNAASDMGTAAQIAQSFAADDMDLICAIATPAAQAAYNAAMDKGIPVVYTAVTNPEEAQLADSDGNPVGAVTGTSDQLPGRLS